MPLKIGIWHFSACEECQIPYIILEERRGFSYFCVMEGMVVKNTGSWYVVRTADSGDVNCKIKGNFRLKGIRTTNPVAVGDRVEIAVNDDGTAFIISIYPRRNYIIRRASNLSKESHILASNLDQAFLVMSLAEPLTSTIFIDRFLATAEAYDVPAVVVINKIDLLDEEGEELCRAMQYLYETIGYKTVSISATKEEGIAELQCLIDGKITLFAGNSGVGKSTLVNCLIPGACVRTAEISEVHHTGIHTTTFSEMYRLPSGNGYIIDTPGVKGFGTIDFNTEEVAHYFPEIFEESHNCRYNNCTHVHEPGCAVKRAVEEHRISESRYGSYLSILEDSASDKYRKPF